MDIIFCYSPRLCTGANKLHCTLLPVRQSRNGYVNQFSITERIHSNTITNRIFCKYPRPMMALTSKPPQPYSSSRSLDLDRFTPPVPLSPVPSGCRQPLAGRPVPTHRQSRSVPTTCGHTTSLEA
ncbi:hypothetical protein BaRGS_00006279 [Batillaria attramentaria]|uniref:Uncharacterized protein n=1 Tax=Batillaria attramentaria TaxID=370345 RepID=A0ABD0LT17_9CAEN